MTELEDLKKRKEELLLKREIERLERENKRRANAEGWSWWWVILLALAGIVLALVSALSATDWNGGIPAVAFGIAALLAFIPLARKLLARR